MHRRLPEAADAALALVLLATGLWFAVDSPLAEDVVEGPTALNLATVALLTLPLAVRRRYPLAVLTTVFAALAIRSAVSDPLEIYTGPVASVVAAYSVAAYGSRRQAVAGLLVIVPCVALAAANGSGGDAAPELIPVLVLCGLVWAIGRVAGTRYARAWTLDQRREDEAREAVVSERERIARELHDSVSHSLGIIAMQAGGAEAIIHRDPERAAASLRAIERTARDGLTEMRRMLGLLQPDDTAAELAPQPGVDRIPALVENARTAGLDVDFESEGESRPLPPGVELSAYRIAQEALTNAVKHAAPCHARLAVRWLPEALEIQVTDAGNGHPNGAGGGRGLIGMRERAHLVGGQLYTGPRSGRPGYRVLARLPTEQGP